MRLISIVLVVCTSVLTISTSSQDNEDIFTEVPYNDTLEINANEIFEGDTLLNKQQINLIYNGKPGRHGKNGTSTANIWPKKTVTYAFADGHYKESHKRIILKAMKTIEKKTCVKFKPKKPEDKHYALIRKGKYCLSNVGYIGQDAQTLMLSIEGCMYHATILHELLHTLGFLHMHNHPKRNKYVRIMWKNLQKGDKRNFKINRNVIDYGVPYDFKSIMHYASKEFSKNGKPTIVSRVKKVKITNNRSLSKGDITKIKRMYSC